MGQNRAKQRTSRAVVKMPGNWLAEGSREGGDYCGKTNQLAWKEIRETGK